MMLPWSKFPRVLRGSPRFTRLRPNALAAYLLAWSSADDDGIIQPSGAADAIDALVEELAMRGRSVEKTWAIESVNECVRNGLIEPTEGGRRIRMVDWIAETKPEPVPAIAAPVPETQQEQVFSVYFIQAGDGGPVKIGCSCSVPERLSVLQIGNAEPLRVLATTPGAFAEEHRLHALFKSDLISGEWFRPSLNLMSFIEQLSAQ